MTTNRFFANAAAKALALAAAEMMSMFFAACSGKNDIPTPELPANAVTIDDEKIPVKSVEYKKYEMSGERFELYLYLSEDKKKDYVEIKGYTAKHLNKDIDLTEVSGWTPPQHTPWEIICRLGDKYVFDAYSVPPSSQGLLFTTGTLRIDGNLNDDEITIRLANGKITDANYGDGKEHTISIDWKGKGTKKS